MLNLAYNIKIISSKPPILEKQILNRWHFSNKTFSANKPLTLYELKIQQFQIYLQSFPNSSRHCFRGTKWFIHKKTIYKFVSSHSMGRTFKPNFLMLQMALQSWCIPHQGQVQLRSLNYKNWYTQFHLPQILECVTKQSISMRLTLYQTLFTILCKLRSPDKNSVPLKPTHPPLISF